MSSILKPVLKCCLILMLIEPAQLMIPSLYCGLDNCYDLLGVTRDTDKNDMNRAYRKLARKWHPDRYRNKEDRAKATVMFQKIATAYEVLKEEESRNDYNYMLDNPEEWYTHYYSYYKKKMAPKIDVRIVLAATITIISAIQYWGAWNSYNMAVSSLISIPKYRFQAEQIAKSEGLINDKRKKERGKSRSDVKREEESILKRIIREKMEVEIPSGQSKPSCLNVLWMQLLFSPYYITAYIIWYATWVWKFKIRGQEFGTKEKEYLIRTSMGLSEDDWRKQDPKDISSYMFDELWKKENFRKWAEIRDAEHQAKLAENGKYKRDKRLYKKGPPQLTFGPE